MSIWDLKVEKGGKEEKNSNVLFGLLERKDFLVSDGFDFVCFDGAILRGKWVSKTFLNPHFEPLPST
jgi:hypothetical protein